jgi:hypothetical protein
MKALIRHSHVDPSGRRAGARSQCAKGFKPSEEYRWAGLGGTGQMPAARCVLDISGGMSLRIGDLGRTNRIQLELDAVAAARNSKDVILSFTRMPHAGDCPASVSFAYSPFVRLITYIIGAPDGVNRCSIIPVVILSSQSIGPIVRMAWFEGETRRPWTGPGIRGPGPWHPQRRARSRAQIKSRRATMDDVDVSCPLTTTFSSVVRLFVRLLLLLLSSLPSAALAIGCFACCPFLPIPYLSPTLRKRFRPVLYNRRSRYPQNRLLHLFYFVFLVGELLQDPGRTFRPHWHSPSSCPVYVVILPAYLRCA